LAPSSLEKRGEKSEKGGGRGEGKGRNRDVPFRLELVGETLGQRTAEESREV
jgi:hypothetical protein